MKSLCMDEGCFPPVSPRRTHQCPLTGSPGCAFPLCRARADGPQGAGHTTVLTEGSERLSWPVMSVGWYCCNTQIHRQGERSVRQSRHSPPRLLAPPVSLRDVSGVDAMAPDLLLAEAPCPVWARAEVLADALQAPCGLWEGHPGAGRSARRPCRLRSRPVPTWGQLQEKAVTPPAQPTATPVVGGSGWCQLKLCFEARVLHLLA